MTPGELSIESLSSTSETEGALSGRSGQWDRFLTLLIVVYCLAVLAIHSFYLFNIGPDAISYFSIAKVYLRGDGALAINTHWAPLFSWLLVPLIATGLTPERGAALLSLPIGTMVFVLTWRTGDLLGIGRKWRRVALLCLFPNLLFWSVRNCGPDLLYLALLLLYLNLLLHPRFSGSLKGSLAAGVIGGISYLAKSYAFPFFLVSFTVVTSWNLFAGRGRFGRLFGCYALGVSAFLIVALPWVVLISLKHQHLTIGTAGSFTLQFKAPNVVLTPTENQGILPPFHEHAISFWEDPGRLKTGNWSPFHSASDLVYYVKTIVYNNFFEAMEVVHGISFFLVGLASVAAFGELGRWLELRGKAFNPVLCLILLLAIYASGYVLIFITDRYLWPVSIGGILLACLAVQRIEASSLWSRKALSIFLVVWVATCFIKPTAFLGRLINFEKQTYVVCRALGEITGRRVASNEFLPGVKAAYYNDARFCGIPLPEMEPNAVAASLKENHVDYFLLWNTENVPAYLKDFVRVDEGRFPGLQVFRSAEAAPAGLSR